MVLFFCDKEERGEEGGRGGGGGGMGKRERFNPGGGGGGGGLGLGRSFSVALSSLPLRNCLAKWKTNLKS